MASRISAVTGLILCVALALFAVQEAKPLKPLVRKDLLILGNGEIAPPIRDIFRPKFAPAPADGGPSGGPRVKPKTVVPPPEAPPAFDLNISYIGSIKSGGRTIALILRSGQTLSVAEGDEIVSGYKVVGVTAEAVVVEGPTGERRTFARQGDRP